MVKVTKLLESPAQRMLSDIAPFECPCVCFMFLWRYRKSTWIALKLKGSKIKEKAKENVLRYGPDCESKPSISQCTGKKEA